MTNKFESGSLAFWLVFISIILSFLIFVPLPHYHHDQGWFMGPSIGARIIDDSTHAAPIDRVVASYISASLESPYEIDCETDLDCNVINVRNQCQTYCADNSASNSEVTQKLEKNRVCDPAKWKPDFTNCRCVFNKCATIEY